MTLGNSSSVITRSPISSVSLLSYRANAAYPPNDSPGLMSTP
ncbi:Uncharacterised protein [Mycobacterium tuberculosis]|nr:Uncharacterised protein [Mycobacterium tuberculosis]CKS57434.1 Uncharacterised protein [Mycobacterium tuberculosis]CPB16186.1 Uncharacterised protein [Mycobacterium tuberculosis]